MCIVALPDLTRAFRAFVDAVRWVKNLHQGRREGTETEIKSKWIDNGSEMVPERETPEKLGVRLEINGELYTIIQFGL